MDDALKCFTERKYGVRCTLMSEKEPTPLETAAKNIPRERLLAIHEFLKEKRREIGTQAQNIPEGRRFPLSIGKIKQLKKHGDAECSVRELHYIKIAVKNWLENILQKKMNVAVQRKVYTSVASGSPDAEAAQALLADSDAMPVMDANATDRHDVHTAETADHPVHSTTPNVPVLPGTIDEPMSDVPVTEIPPPIVNKDGGKKPSGKEKKYPDARTGAQGILDELKAGKRKPQPKP